MSIDEGYIKFNCDWEKIATEEVLLDSGLSAEEIKELLVVRNQVFEMGLIGFDEKNKVGFGNISIKCPTGAFLISGTQTGHISDLEITGYALVDTYNIGRNYLHCKGQAKASSESLSHAAIYEALQESNAVVHIHSENLWQWGMKNWTHTAPDVAYGTPEMAQEVKKCLADPKIAKAGCLVMGGHREGLLFFSKSLKDTLLAINEYKERASGK